MGLRLAVLGLVLSTVGCGGAVPTSQRAAPEGAEPAASPATPAPVSRLEETGGRSQLVAPFKGLAQIGHLQPRTRREGGETVTTFQIKNLDVGPIAGLTIDQFWYDANGNTATIGTYRHRRPLMPGEVVEVEVRVQTNPEMRRSAYSFSHQNGKISMRLLQTLDDAELDG